jgi:hypothetical protein
MGRIRAAIWVNETDNGVRHNVTFARLYRDEQHDQWKDSTSFGRDDLPLIAKVADLAHSWIYQQAAQARAAQNQAGNGAAAKDVDPDAEPAGVGAGADNPF